MRYLLIASLVLMVASVACAATPGQVPDSTLAMMGISGAQPMSDVQGADIRGTSFVVKTAYAHVSGTTNVTTPCAAVCSTYCATAKGGCVAVAAGGTIVIPSAYICGVCLTNVVVTGSVAVGVK